MYTGVLVLCYLLTVGMLLWPLSMWSTLTLWSFPLHLPFLDLPQLKNNMKIFWILYLNVSLWAPDKSLQHYYLEYHLVSLINNKIPMWFMISRWGIVLAQWVAVLSSCMFSLWFSNYRDVQSVNVQCWWRCWSSTTCISSW